MSYVHFQYGLTPSHERPMTLTEFGDADLHKVLGKMAGGEKMALLAGTGWWMTAAIPRLGIPGIKMSDGPNGVRGSSHFLSTPANCIPCATALGATFDTKLIYDIAGLLARDAKAKGSSVLLAPTVNIQRNPLNGRAFESFSEDPHLSGTIAAAYINGLQDRGVGASIKHFVCNDMEHMRHSVSVEVGERALREIYLKPFMLAEKHAKPWAVMTSYSRVNGVHNNRLKQENLRDEWKFDGLVMSDWFGVYSTDASLHAGMDLEMPGPTRWRGIQIPTVLMAGKLSMKDVDARVYAVLQLAQRSVCADIENVRHNMQPEQARDAPEDRALNRRVAADSIVLLRNDKGFLPLNKNKLRRVLVTGPNAKTLTVSGGGSAYLESGYVVTPYDGVVAALEGTGAEVVYTPGCFSHKYLPTLDGLVTTANGKLGWKIDFYNKIEDAPIATFDTFQTRMRINDFKPEGLEDRFFLVGSAFMKAQESGPFEFGLSVVGRARLYIGDELVVDNGFDTQQTRGEMFYGIGTVEEKSTVELVKGRDYRIKVEYTNHMPPDAAGNAGQPNLVLAALRLSGSPKVDTDEAIAEAVSLAETCDAVVCFTGGNLEVESEGIDRQDMNLPGRQNELIEKLLDACPEKSVIVNQTGSAFAFPWVDKANSLLQAWYLGNETVLGNAIADVLFGNVNPSGRLPMSFPHAIEHCAGHLNWGAENGKIYYGEGLFVGHRGHGATGRDTMFAFGEGHSYTTFEWTHLRARLNKYAEADDIRINVSLEVRNTGSLESSEVVQLYIKDPVCSLRRPHRELKGFAKVTLKPGETKTVDIELDKYALSYFDDAESSWVAEKGEFLIYASKSHRSRDIVATASIDLDETVRWKGL